jgi:hypothetical protein
VLADATRELGDQSASAIAEFRFEAGTDTLEIVG